MTTFPMVILKAVKTLQAAVPALTIPIPIIPAEALQAVTTPATPLPKQTHPKAVVREIIIKEIVPTTAALIAVIRVTILKAVKTLQAVIPALTTPIPIILT